MTSDTLKIIADALDNARQNTSSWPTAFGNVAHTLRAKATEGKVGPANESCVHGYPAFGEGCPDCKPGPAPVDDLVERAAKAFAEATNYYTEFHAGLSAPSADKIRAGVRAALQIQAAEITRLRTDLSTAYKTIEETVNVARDSGEKSLRIAELQVRADSAEGKLEKAVEGLQKICAELNFESSHALRDYRGNCHQIARATLASLKGEGS